MAWPHCGDKPCYACKYHRYSSFREGLDKCVHPETEFDFIRINRQDTTASNTCGRDAKWFQIKTKTYKKWWQFWKREYE